MSLPTLDTLIDERHVVLCVGCGGVGKTTVAAALALAGARRGKRVLCLTIDPARRLANSLGLDRMTGEAQRVEPALFQRAGLEVQGSLTVMMLDTKRTFDELVTRHASTPAARDKILENRLYQYVSTSLAGTQEYMAMEKLLSVKQDDHYDLIVLDTPPTSNALDFLDAPERITEAIDSAAMLSNPRGNSVSIWSRRASRSYCVELASSPVAVFWSRWLSSSPSSTTCLVASRPARQRSQRRFGLRSSPTSW